MRNPLRLGSLCTGYGGLDLGVGQVLNVEHAWHAELDPDASAVLAARWPGVPNLGDLRTVDWSTVKPVDVLTAGFPCQPVSAAGRRKGINDERWLWDDLATAVGRMDPRPRLLVLENVAGLLTANRGHALARVVRGLAALGYVGRYRLLRASDVGAAHRRERWFCAAQLASDAAVHGYGYTWPACVRRLPVAPVAGGAGADGISLLPTPNATDGQGGVRAVPERRSHGGADHGPRLRDVAPLLLPTPAARDGRRGAGWGDQPGRPLSETIHRLLPTPTVVDSRGGRNATARRSPGADAHGGTTLSDVAYADRWGDYAPAVRRWEAITGRAAPDPTEPGRTGNPRLAPRFVEWLMGLPDGWVTEHLGRSAALRVLGNGVVPAQAAAAVLALSDTRPYPPEVS